jgi:hypothetical protein
MSRLLDQSKAFFSLVAVLALLNVGIALSEPRPAIAQQCETERSNCLEGECQSCTSCICWECGRDCERRLR